MTSAGTGEEGAAAVPFVSVVIPVRNGEATIGDCLVALERGDYPAARREIVVVDNGSTDATGRIVRGHPVRYIHEPRRSPSIARNQGILATRGEIVAMTDADCLPTRGWIREIVRAFAGERVGGVAGEILPFPPATAAERYAARLRHLSPRRYLRRPVLPFAVTANLAFRSHVFGEVGLFDEASPKGGESTDFCTRFFRGTGLELRFAERAVVLHRHRSSARELLRQQWGYGRGHAFLYHKYRDVAPWGWRQRVHVYRDLARAILDVPIAAAQSKRGSFPSAELEFAWFELLRKVALRGGFVHESLARRRRTARRARENRP